VSLKKYKYVWRTYLTSSHCYRPSLKARVKCDGPDSRQRPGENRDTKEPLTYFRSRLGISFLSYLPFSVNSFLPRPVFPCARVYKSLSLRLTQESALITARSIGIELSPFTHSHARYPRGSSDIKGEEDSLAVARVINSRELSIAMRIIPFNLLEL